MKKLSEWNKEKKIKTKNNDMNIIDINGSKKVVITAIMTKW